MSRSLLLSGLFLLGCWLIAAADSLDGAESKATEPDELPERAVFEVHHAPGGFNCQQTATFL